jgi:hypothetical protein
MIEVEVREVVAEHRRDTLPGLEVAGLRLLVNQCARLHRLLRALWVTGGAAHANDWEAERLLVLLDFETDVSHDCLRNLETITRASASVRHVVSFTRALAMRRSMSSAMKAIRPWLRSRHVTLPWRAALGSADRCGYPRGCTGAS